MQLHVNPHELILIGENSFIRLSTDGGQTASTRCSHWRVLWTPVGPGNVLFVDSGATDGVRIYADSEPLVRFLQKEIEWFLYKPFAPTDIPVVAAQFERDGVPPGVSAEVVRTAKEEIRLSWSEFIEPFNFAADPGFDGRPLGVQTTFFPALRAQLQVGGRKAEGEPWKIERGGKPCTTACLAWCESWFRPRGKG
jgi:hypothetical protein